MLPPLLAVTPLPLDLMGLVERVLAERAARAEATGDENAGAVTSFLGTVRDKNQGRRVTALDYEAYEPLAVRVFERIAEEIAREWPDTVLALHHRTGDAEDWRGQRGHRGRVAAPRRGVCRVPLRDRARQADRADLEARNLRGRRHLDRRRRRRSGRRNGADRRTEARMRVTVRLFAQLRDLAGASDLDCTLDGTPDATGANTARVEDVWRALLRDHPALASFGRAMSVAVNLDYARMDAPVRDGDEVAFLPPVSGG